MEPARRVLRNGRSRACGVVLRRGGLVDAAVASADLVVAAGGEGAAALGAAAVAPSLLRRRALLAVRRRLLEHPLSATQNRAALSSISREQRTFCTLAAYVRTWLFSGLKMAGRGPGWKNSSRMRRTTSSGTMACSCDDGRRAMAIRQNHLRRRRLCARAASSGAFLRFTPSPARLACYSACGGQRVVRSDRAAFVCTPHVVSVFRTFSPSLVFGRKG